ncbi:SDR family oxidoreductase [Phytohabitans sp. LJ34]|uniref:SDR family oxidoreductase n=1 Tax=Phytohabitans sp. LJ34 TaxID=3452217 RepID=UPI003F891C43
MASGVRSTSDDLKARELVRAASGAGVRHLVYISVVGADRVPVTSRADRTMFGYYAAKLGGERVVAESGIPWTTLRATQFHDLMLRTAAQMAKLPVLPVPSGMRVQPVDSAAGRGPDGRARARRAGRSRAGPRWPAGVRHGRADPRLPARRR